MRVNKSNNYRSSQPNFKSVNIIQINKRVFKTPEDLAGIQSFANYIFNKLADIKTNTQPSFFNKIGLVKQKKQTFSYLEQPYYVPIRKKLKEMGDYSLSWLSQNKKIPVREPLNQDYHSFFLYTKEHKDFCVNLDKQLQTAAKKQNTSPVELNQVCIEKYAEFMGNEPIKVFTIDSLEQLSSTFKQIEV